MSTGVKQDRPALTLKALLIIVGTIGVLFLAREVFIPVALAAFFTILLTPLARSLERIHLGRAMSAISVSMAALAVSVLIGWFITVQAAEVLLQLPDYQSNIVSKIRAVRSSLPSYVGETSKTLEEIKKEITQPASEGTDEGQNRRNAESNGSPEGIDPALPGDGPNSDRSELGHETANPPLHSQESAAAPADYESSTEEEEASEPVKVEMVPSFNEMLAQLGWIIGPVVHPLVTILIAAVFMIFFLLFREDLLDRLIRVVSSDHPSVATAALTEAGVRVQRYLFSLAIANTINGIAISVGLLALGVPNAFVWGLLTAILRFIPVLGAWIAAAFPILVSFAVSDGWGIPVLVGLWILLVDQLSVNFLEPFLYGSHAGASPTAILISFVFWAWLWGGIGLLLATPITIGLIIVGRRIPAFAVFHILLGDDRALSPQTRFCQRALAGDAEGAYRVLKDFGADHDAASAVRDVVLPARKQVRREVTAGILSLGRERTTQRLIDEVTDRFEKAEGEQPQPGANSGGTKESETARHADAASKH